MKKAPPRKKSTKKKSNIKKVILILAVLCAVYEYSVNGGTYNSSDQIDYDTYKRLNIGDTVSVLVNNNDYNKTELLLEQDKIHKFHIDF